MGIIEMDPELVWKAIEGYDDELSSEQKALDAFYRQFVCPQCRSACRKETVAGHAFATGSLVPRSVLRCMTCSHLFDPHTGITLELGRRDQTPDGVPIIRPKPE